MDNKTSSLSDILGKTPTLTIPISFKKLFQNITMLTNYMLKIITLSWNNHVNIKFTAKAMTIGFLSKATIDISSYRWVQA